MISTIVKRAISIGIFMLIAAILSALVGLIMALPVMFLWNWIVPQLTNGWFQKLNYFQAWGLITLIGILFSSGRSVDKD